MPASEIVLTQRYVHKSIRAMEATTLPPFTLLTGINGSGKSHLLDAIRKGVVTTNLTKDHVNEISHYDWNTLVPNDAGITNISQVHANRDWFINTARSRRSEREAALFDLLARHGLDTHFSARPWSAMDAGILDFERVGLSAQSAHQAYEDIQGLSEQIKDHVSRDLGQDEIKRALFERLSNEGRKFHRLQYSDFDKWGFSGYGPNLFQHSFGELFFGYFDKQRTNAFGEQMIAKGKTPSVPPLNDAEFVAKHGEPPWEFVNETLERARLDFRIDYPSDVQATEYLPKLTKVSTGDDVQFTALSSGEKVLMSFAFCLYNSTDRRQSIKRPKLLLFDEIDAPLHPSMSGVLVKIIKDVLVDREGIPVIFVTHSPSTVAVAPDTSIHLVTANPTRITRESKRRAVSVLTADIPTMSIDFSGRRQVFAESDYDAERYQALFQILAPFIKTERSLSFIGVGHANMNTGCAHVEKTVDALAKGGNTSVLGLIDWDMKNRGSDRVYVVGSGARYASENYLLDPILVAAALLYLNPERGVDFLGLDRGDTFAVFANLSKEKLQAASRAVEGAVLSALKVAGMSETVVSRYSGGLTLVAERLYQQADAHDLEKAVKEAFPELRRFNQTGQLLLFMIDQILRNHHRLTPTDLVDAFVHLCNVEL